ncbi:unnamed protein product, partial [Prorocentrum cordatum]
SLGSGASGARARAGGRPRAPRARAAAQNGRPRRAAAETAAGPPVHRSRLRGTPSASPDSRGGKVAGAEERAARRASGGLGLGLGPGGEGARGAAAAGCAPDDHRGPSRRRASGPPRGAGQGRGSRGHEGGQCRQAFGAAGHCCQAEGGCCQAEGRQGQGQGSPEAQRPAAEGAPSRADAATAAAAAQDTVPAAEEGGRQAAVAGGEAGGARARGPRGEPGARGQGPAQAARRPPAEAADAEAGAEGAAAGHRQGKERWPPQPGRGEGGRPEVEAGAVMPRVGAFLELPPPRGAALRPERLVQRARRRSREIGGRVGRGPSGSSGRAVAKPPARCCTQVDRPEGHAQRACARPRENGISHC